MTLPDFESYRAKKDEMLADYEDRKAWAKMMLTNISKAGFFSSDRTIEQYNNCLLYTSGYGRALAY